MDALGMKALLDRVQAERPGTALETLYRWRQAINDGRGIPDRNKATLVRATAGSEHAIDLADFYEAASPASAEEARP
jgi:hypothetical protein